ncbi:Glu/Leu/Phe/Val dehydrogenase [bacterium]|nr:Glu/Leu/Phe/Val dehydrogenase [bacterium]
MALVKLARMKKFINIPRDAEILLNNSRKEIKLALNIKIADENLACLDTFIVYHNTALGPAKGGIRLAPDVSFKEVRTLAEIMTYKNALMRLPFGGGKSGIRLDPYKIETSAKVAIIKEYVRMIREELYSGSYIPAPDLGSSPLDMAVIYGETRKPETVTGKPIVLGGLSGRIQATGRGLSKATKLGVENILKKNIEGTNVAIQGFGNVGRWTAHFLSEMGVKVIAVFDIGGVIYNKKGIDIEALFKYAPLSKDSINNFPFAEAITEDEFFSLKTDVFIPAAVESVITKSTAQLMQAKLIVEGANNPTTEEGEEVLLNKGINILPDFYANSGGVIASYIEWKDSKSGNKTSEKEVFELIDAKIDSVFWQGMKAKKKLESTSREAFFYIALNTLLEAMEARLWI